MSVRLSHTTNHPTETTGFLLQRERFTGREPTDTTAAPIVASPPPPVSKWIHPALLCALACALYNVCIKKGSATIHPILGGVVLECVAALFGGLALAILLVYQKLSPPAETNRHQGSSENNQRQDGYIVGEKSSDDTCISVRVEKDGIWWSIGAGVWVGVAEIISFVVSGPMGVPVTQSIPIIVGGSVLFAAVLGSLCLKESMVLTHGWFGVAMLTLGIILVSTAADEHLYSHSNDFKERREGAPLPSAPLFVWLSLALCCAMAYALYNIGIKQGSSSVHPIVGGVILQVVAAIFGLCALGAILVWNENVRNKGGGEARTVLHYDSSGVLWSSLAGVAVGIAELLSFGVSGMGVKATQSIPILIGGSVAFGAVIGIFVLGEGLDLQGWVGVLLLVSGIGVVGTDPHSIG